MSEVLARAFVEAVFGDWERVVEAVVADGWPRKMVEAGFGFHRESWDVGAMAKALGREMGAVDEGRQRVVWPSRVHHIWPALPGAGVSPYLFGELLGRKQAVAASSRGRHLAEYLAAKTGMELVEGDERWACDAVVVSGSDATLEAVRERVRPGTRLVGYGHRVSFGVVVDGGGLDLAALAREAAVDVVMWHQRGCFSLRAVVFVGSEVRRRAFGAALAEEIGALERAWAACEVGEEALALRAQALGVAEMMGEVFRGEVGFVVMRGGVFGGEKEAVHSVGVYGAKSEEEVSKVVGVARHQVQGIALAVEDGDEREGWVERLSRMGATRVCGFGRLQAPPPDWWHDGEANVLSWGRVVTVE